MRQLALLLIFTRAYGKIRTESSLKTKGDVYKRQSLGLGWMINEKQQWVDPKPVLQQIEVLSEKLHLKSLSAWLPFEKWFGKEQPVAAAVSYELIQDHYYKPASGNQVQSIADGVVLYIGEQESGAIVMVKQDNGVLVTYGALQEVQVHLNDRILKGRCV